MSRIRVIDHAVGRILLRLDDRTGIVGLKAEGETEYTDADAVTSEVLARKFFDGPAPSAACRVRRLGGRYVRQRGITVETWDDGQQTWRAADPISTTVMWKTP